MHLKSELKKIPTFVTWVFKDAKPFLLVLTSIMVLQVLNSLGSVAVAISSKYMIDYAVEGQYRPAVFAASLFACLILANIGMGVWASLLSARASEALANAMRQRIYMGLITAEWKRLNGYHSGDLTTRLTSDIGVITNGVVNLFPSIIALGAQLIAAFATLLFYEPKLAIFAFILGPASVLFSRIWGRKFKKIQVRVQETESRYRSFIQETLQNLLIVKSFNMEENNNMALQGLHKDRMTLVLERNRLSVIAGTVLAMGYWIGYFLAFGWGAYQLSLKAITIGTMTIFLQLVEQVQGPFIGLSRTLPQIISMMASMDRLVELENIEKEISSDSMPSDNDLGVQFKSVSFSYDGNQSVLDKASVVIPPGEIVALTGSSGEGKTTMIRLLLALVRPAEGEVKLVANDGTKYDVTAATRKMITYVPQGNTLFSGTIADNLRCGNTNATNQDMIEAAKAACAWEFIEQLPNGLDTVIGEKGVGLSEGQAQRIAIARALLKPAPILILDEATSALDVNTELEVLKALKKKKKSSTCLVITHRPSALQICTRILNLRDGMIVQEQ